MLKEFHYPSINQRRLVYAAVFLTIYPVTVVTILYLLRLHYYLPYGHSEITTGYVLMAGIFLGNLAGLFLYRIIQASRWLLRIQTLFFVSALGGLVALLMPQFSLITLQQQNGWFLPASGAAVAALASMMMPYHNKIASGEFIDEHTGMKLLLWWGFLAVPTGFIAALATTYFKAPLWAPFLPVLALPVINFIIRLPFTPDSSFYSHHTDDEEKGATNATIRDDLIFTYLNFSFTAIYLFLGSQTLQKYYGVMLPVKAIHFGVASLSLLGGYAFGRMLKKTFWNIFTEMLFPVFFLAGLIPLHLFHKSIPVYQGALFFAPLGIILGTTLYHTLSSLARRFDHHARYTVLNVSIYLLPIPVIAALHIAPFTHLHFFIILYAMALMNLILPGIHLAAHKTQMYKKASFLLFSLLFFPAILMVHVLFSIPVFSSERYLRETDNYTLLRDTNFNARYIKNSGIVRYHNEPAFELDDSIIKNLQRALLPLMLYTKPSRDPFLVIDGTQRFYRNKSLFLYKNAVIYDPIPDRAMDYYRLPFTGSQKFLVLKKKRLTVLTTEKNEYRVVVDILNAFDQRFNTFLFSEEYLQEIQRLLASDGIYARVRSLRHCDNDLKEAGDLLLNQIFPASRRYRFADIELVLWAAREEAFTVSTDHFNEIDNEIIDNPLLQKLTVNAFHLAAHMLPEDENSPEKDIATHHDMRITGLHTPPDNCENSDCLRERKLDTMLADISGDDFALRGIASRFNSLEKPVTLLLNSECEEARGAWIEETEHLFELKKITAWFPELRDYITSILEYKEEAYLEAARRFESQKEWDKALKLYEALRIINPQNFPATYRSGLIALTLQDLDTASSLLEKAMSLNPEEPQVHLQMGILKFSLGDYNGAIKHLLTAKDQKVKNVSLFLYLGLSYEKLGRLQQAADYFELARREDPSDASIEKRIENVEKLIQMEKDRWKMPEQRNQLEDEQGEKIPLPINKSAYDIRLKEEENNESTN